MSIIGWARKREKPAQRLVYRLLKSLAAVNLPGPRFIFAPLARIRLSIKEAWKFIAAKIYYEPLFRASCARVGRNLQLLDGMPRILGDLNVEIGDCVSLEGAQVWIAAGPGAQARTLHIGNNSYLGYQAQVIVGTLVEIGANVLISNRVILSGYDGHPLDPLERANHAPCGPEGARPILIGDFAWIGANAIILRGVEIGAGSVVATGAVVTRNVEPLTVVGGNPAKIIRRIPEPPGWAVHPRATEQP